MLAPLSLAVLALGGALSIVGLVLRYAFGVLTVAIGVASSRFLTWTDRVRPTPISAVASTVTDTTGITGSEAVDALVAEVRPTAWPALTFVARLLLLAAGVFILVTARSWTRTGRRYESDAATPVEAGADAPASRPYDAIDSWDDLSRGADPTARAPQIRTAGPR